MATFFTRLDGAVRILDAGAGVGSLVAGALAEATLRRSGPDRIAVEAFELDPKVVPALRATLRACGALCRERQIPFQGRVRAEDFVASALSARAPRFTHAILNPPYLKLSAASPERRALREVGLDATNVYAAFVALAIDLLVPGGELVAITPRSFCSGPYFRPFREHLLRETSLRRLHLFDSRRTAFADDAVLQENVVLHVVKGARQGKVLISTSSGARRRAPFADVVRAEDPERFIHHAADASLAAAFERLPSRLDDLGLSVSTGKVVDFRVKELLRARPGRRTQPLVYPSHFDRGVVRWPKEGKKPNALVDAARSAGLFLPSATYVLVRRLSSKEERRRLVAAIFDPRLVVSEKVGFENHLNVFHRGGGGLDRTLARGLAAFLNSASVDAYFRQWSGHTQVNATDLRSLRYPSAEALCALARERSPDRAVDALLGLS